MNLFFFFFFNFFFYIYLYKKVSYLGEKEVAIALFGIKNSDRSDIQGRHSNLLAGFSLFFLSKFKFSLYQFQ